jgi:hypothetical protein
VSLGLAAGVIKVKDAVGCRPDGPPGRLLVVLEDLWRSGEVLKALGWWSMWPSERVPPTSGP